MKKVERLVRIGKVLDRPGQAVRNAFFDGLVQTEDHAKLAWIFLAFTGLGLIFVALAIFVKLHS